MTKYEDDEKYGEFEQVNGAVVNRLMNEVNELIDKIESNSAPDGSYKENAEQLEVGGFIIKWLDIDNLLITKIYENGFKHEIKICDGDLETLLSVLLMTPEKKYISSNSITETTYKTTFIK